MVQEEEEAQTEALFSLVKNTIDFSSIFIIIMTSSSKGDKMDQKLEMSLH